MASAARNNTRDNVEIFVREVDADDNMIEGYYQQCMTAPENALPYVNEFKQGTYSGLIHEYDNVTINELQPARVIPSNGLRPESRIPAGRYHDEFKQKFQRIAVANDCNIIVWVSENKYCTIGQAVFREFESKIRTFLNQPKFRNDKKTVIVLVACNSLETAAQLNARRTENTPFYIGFNGQVHPYKSELFLCKNYLVDEEFPIRLCKTESDPMHLGRMREVLSGNIANERLTEREKCCKTMIKEYPVHFAEAFKGQRDCIKIGWEQMSARIGNLINKRGPLTPEDSAIRAYDSRGTGHYDGIYCRTRPEHENDCGIDRSLVNNSTRSNAQRYLNRYTAVEKKWGELLNDLANNAGQFTELLDSISWGTMSPERKRELINTKSATKGSALNIIVGNIMLPIDRKQEIIRYLLENGASTNSQINRTESFATQILDNENMDFVKFLLLSTDVNMQTDEAMRNNRNAPKKFKQVMEYIIKELKDIAIIGHRRINSETKNSIHQFFDSINPYLLTMVDGFLEYRRPATAARTVAGDYRVLEYLRTVSGNTGLSGYNTIKNQMETFRAEAARQAQAERLARQEAHTAATGNATGGRRGKQRKATRKQRKNRKSKTRKH